MVERSDQQGKWRCTVCGLENGKYKVRRHAEVHLDMTHSCIVCAKNFKTRNALSTHYTRYHANDVLSPWTNRTWANKCFPKLMGVFTFDRLTIINGLGNELHHNFDPNLNFRPEYVAGVDDSTSRRWWTIEVSVSNVWKDHVGKNKDEAPRWSAPGPRPHMHRMSKAVQNQKLFVSSLFFDAQEPSPVSLGNNLTWNTADHVLVVMLVLHSSHIVDNFQSWTSLK